MRPYCSPIRKGASTVHPVGYESLVLTTLDRVAWDLVGPDPLAQKDAILWLKNELEEWAELKGFHFPVKGVRAYILRAAQAAGTLPDEAQELLEGDPQP